MADVFDATVFFGPYHRSDVDTSPAAVLERMKRASIETCLAVSLFAIEHDMEEGNEQILALAGQFRDQLVPVAVVAPGQYVPGRGLMNRLCAQGFRVAAFFPGMQGWPLELLSFRAAALEAAEAGMVIMVAVGGRGEASRVARSLDGIDAPVILRCHSGGGYVLADEFLAIGEQCPNYHFDVWNCVGAGQIRLLADELGADRLVYGSGLPLCRELSSRFLVQTAGLSAADLGLVLGGTLRRLLGIERGAGESVELPTDPMVTRPKVDVHYHFGEWNILLEGTSIDQTIAEFDTFGFEYGIMSSSAALRGDASGGNAVVAAALDDDRRMLGYVYLDPYHPAESSDDLEKYAADRRFVGVKTRPDYHGTTLEHPAYRPLLERAAALDLPLLTHNCGVRHIAERVPDLRIVIAHASRKTAEQYADLPNVHFCIASSDCFALGTDVRGMIDAAGIERILFGSDGPLISPAWTIGKFAHADLSDDELACIFRKNARRVFPRLHHENAAQ